MQTKMLNVNEKILLGVFSVVLVITAISIIPLVFSLAGGQGQAKGNSCMATCMGTNAPAYDLSKEITQHCRYMCNAGVGEGVCTEALDGCCVPETSDPDCGCPEGKYRVTIYIQNYEGQTVDVQIFDNTGALVDFGQTTTGYYYPCLPAGEAYNAEAWDSGGNPIGVSAPFNVPTTETIVI